MTGIARMAVGIVTGAMADLKPAYLVYGDDDVKLDSWRRRLRKRAAEEGASLQIVEGDESTPAGFAQATQALTLAVGRRYLLVEGVERWKAPDAEVAAEALQALPGETIVLLIAAGPQVKKRTKQGTKWQWPVPGPLEKAVRAAGGDVQVCGLPRGTRIAGWVVDRGAEVGLTVGEEAAQALLERAPVDDKGKVRMQALMRELEKLAIYAPDDGRLERETVEFLTAPDVEHRAYELAEALVAGNRPEALLLAEDLRQRGVEMMHIVYALLRKVGDTYRVAAMIEAGSSTDEIASALHVPAFVARQIAARAEGADSAFLERILDDLADLDYAVRGGTNRDAGTSLTLMLAGTPS